MSSPSHNETVTKAITWCAIAIKRVQSRVQQPCKFTGTKESLYIRKELNSHRTGRFTVLGHQHGCNDVIGHFRVPLCLCFKTSLRTNLLFKSEFDLPENEWTVYRPLFSRIFINSIIERPDSIPRKLDASATIQIASQEDSI